MIKFFKFILFVVILLFLCLVGAFYYVNSNSFAYLVQNRMSSELGNAVSFKDLRLHSNGDLTVKGLVILDLDKNPLLKVKRVELGFILGDLFTQDYLPQEVELFDVDLDFKVKENQWPLAILNKEKKLPPSPNFYAKVKNMNLKLDKLDALLKKYTVDLDLLSAAIEQVPVISSLSTKGVVSERALKFDSVDFGIFSGEVKSVVSILLSDTQQIKEAGADLDLINIDLSKAGEFAKLDPFHILGRLNGAAQLGFGQDGVKVDTDLKTGLLTLTGPGVDKALYLLGNAGKTLNFTTSHVKLTATDDALKFSKLELLNPSFISLYAPTTKVGFGANYQLQHIHLPLRLSAPYSVIKWRDFLMKNNPKYIEIPFDLNCDYKDLNTELINALLSTIQKKSLKKSIKKLEDKLGFKVDNQVIDVKKIIDSDIYKEVKQKVKKQVEQIDRKQVNKVIDLFGKDDKKKKKLKKHIDLFMQFLQ